ncbi:MAG: dockerin type I domain-containing protein [Planctomycetota bacterium]
MKAAYVTCLLLSLTVTSSALASTTTIEFSRGDVDGNGVLNLDDAALIFAMTTGGLSRTTEPLDASDTNEDGRVDIGDAVYLLRLLSRSANMELRATSEQVTRVVGDADGNGRVTVADLVLLGLHVSGNRPDLARNVAFQAADIDGDGEYTVEDIDRLIGIM